MAAVDLILALLVLLMPWVALAAAVAPLVVMSTRRRWPVAGVALWLSAVALAVGWVVASVVEMDRVDATDGAGNAFSEVGWLVGAIAAAVVSIVLTGRSRGVRA